LIDYEKLCTLLEAKRLRLEDTRISQVKLLQ